MLPKKECYVNRGPSVGENGAVNLFLRRNLKKFFGRKARKIKGLEEERIIFRKNFEKNKTLGLVRL